VAAFFDMPAERGAAADLDGPHDALLLAGERMGLPVGFGTRQKLPVMLCTT